MRQAAGLKPLPGTPAPEAKPEPGHKRGTETTHRQPGQHPELRGIPLVGSGPGVINGTRPGDSATRLQQAQNDIRTSLMRHARTNLRKN
jgi:hypothetical protein